MVDRDSFGKCLFGGHVFDRSQDRTVVRRVETPGGNFDWGGQSEVETTVGDRLLQLRRELQDAIDGEAYEDAARIRDEISDIEEASSESRSW